MTRTHKLNGEVLPYAISERQYQIVLEEAMRRADGKGLDALRAAEIEVAKELATSFLAADVRADGIVGLSEARAEVPLEVMQLMIRNGVVDALVVFSLMDVASERAVGQHQRGKVRRRYAATNRQRIWVELMWHERRAGQYKSRTAFATWCIENCTPKITTELERVRDKWVPTGKA